MTSGHPGGALPASWPIWLGALACAWALLGWSLWAGPEGPGEAIELAHLPAAELEELRYEGPGFEVTLWPRHDELGRYVWARTRRDPNPSGEETQPVVREFRVDAERGEQLLASLAPLTSPRQLPVEGAAQLEAMGLAGSQERMTATTRAGSAMTWRLGQEGYGHRRVYARLESEGAGAPVVLLEAELVRSLRFADARLPERDLTDISGDELVGVRIRRAGRQLELVRRANPRAPDMRWWEFEGRRGRSRAAQRWVDALMRLRAKGYSAPPEGLAPWASVELVAADGRRQRLELLARGERYWARSAWLRGAVELYEGRAPRVFEGVDELLRARDEEELLAPMAPGDAHEH